jgi:hypothetical protein
LPFRPAFSGYSLAGQGRVSRHTSLYPFTTAFLAYFPLFSGKPDKRAKRKKEGLMMKCAKLFVVGMMLTALVVAGAGMVTGDR